MRSECLPHHVVEVRNMYRMYRSSGLSAYSAMHSAMYAVPIGHGIEYLGTTRSGSAVYYINMGDTYDATVLAYVSGSHATGWRVTFRYGSWGDLVERGYVKCS